MDVLSVFVMIFYRALLILRGETFWFLGHTVCFLSVSILLSNVLVKHFVPVLSAEERKEKSAYPCLNTADD